MTAGQLQVHIFDRHAFGEEQTDKTVILQEYDEKKRKSLNFSSYYFSVLSLSLSLSLALSHVPPPIFLSPSLSPSPLPHLSFYFYLPPPPHTPTMKVIDISFGRIDL